MVYDVAHFVSLSAYRVSKDEDRWLHMQINIFSVIESNSLHLSPETYFNTNYFHGYKVAEIFLYVCNPTLAYKLKWNTDKLYRSQTFMIIIINHQLMPNHTTTYRRMIFISLTHSWCCYPVVWFRSYKTNVKTFHVESELVSKTHLC